MSIYNITSKVFTPTNILSSLDSSTSLLPLLVKDTANTAGRTMMAEKTGGEHEGRERFIEEAGTAALWLGGIPLFRKIFDKTVFKAYGLNSEISINKIFKKSPQQLSETELKKLSPDAPTALVGKKLIKKYKHLHISKFLVSTLVPFALLTLVLPKLNQKLSEKIIIERALKEKEQRKKSDNLNSFQGKSPEFSSNINNAKLSNLKNLEKKFVKNTLAPINFAGNKNASFTGMGSIMERAGGGLLNAAAGAETNAVGNLCLLDFGITGNRVTFVPRNNQERAEYAFKEGSFLFFIFFAQNLIDKGFKSLSKKFKLPVDLDFKILSSKHFKEKMKEVYNSNTKEKARHLTQFTEQIKPQNIEKDAYNFIKNNHKNDKFYTLQAAKEIGIIKTTKNGELNSIKYIDIKKVEKLSKNIGNFATTMKESKFKPEEFIKRAKNLKTAFLVANFAICSAALGYILPKLQYIFREKVYGSKEYPGIRAYKQEAEEILASKQRATC